MTDDLIGTTVANRYRLDAKIGVGGMGAVYRATDRLNGQVIALKQVTLYQGDTPTADEHDFHLALAQEFRALATLRHPNIISVLDYGFDTDFATRHRSPFLTMELLEDATNIIQAGKDLPRKQQTALLAQMLQALFYLHRRGIIHRDLKPDNVMVITDEYGKHTVKVLDFGLALARGEHTEYQAGTLAYMAPEIIQGDAPSEESDLYAAGVLAYELYAGEYPYDSEDFSRLVMEIMNTVPDVWSLAIDPILQETVQRMLAKNPADRFANAGLVLRALAAASSTATLTENDQIRESFLQAASFVGRDAEFNTLNNALVQVINAPVVSDEVSETVGATWIIGGESGVGKSRLLDEVRTQALVEGALVLRGQAVQENNVPYVLWRDVIRQLCLQIKLSPLEIAALKAIAPDLDTLLGTSVPTGLDANLATNRHLLYKSVEIVLHRQIRPIVLILEDLQWAHVESLAVLKHLIQIAPSTRLLILGSYREDEYPDLTDHLPGAEVIMLDRLPHEAIVALSESMLGESGRSENVVDTLVRETEGNVFFIVEAVRALAENSGSLADVGLETLPPTIFAEGMKSIVQRRLSGLPEEARPLLYVAAMYGRMLNLDLLQAIDAPMAFGDWLYVCEMGIILEVRDNGWHFVHDKLREGLLDELSAESFVNINEQIALTLEDLYNDDPTYAARLALHWEQANRPLLAFPYLLRVYRQRAHGDPAHLRDLFTRAERIYRTYTVPTDLKVQFLIWTGERALRAHKLTQAEEDLQRALTLADQNGLHDERGAALVSLAQLYTQRGDLARANGFWQQNLALRQSMDDPLQVTQAMLALAGGYTAAVELDKADQVLDEAIVNAQSTADHQGIAAATEALADLTRQRQADTEKVVQLYHTSLDLYEILEQTDAMLGVCLKLAHLHIDQHAFDAARTYLFDAATHTQDLVKPTAIPELVGSLARLHLTAGDTLRAIEYLSALAASPHTPEPDVQQARAQLQQIQATQSADAFRAAVDVGRVRTLSSVLDDLLAGDVKAV